MQADADGWFDLGSGREDSEHWHDHWSLGFRTDGCATVYGGLWGDVSDHTSFVGVAPRLTTLLGTVRTPDGARADPATAVVSANCRATRCAWDAPSDAWRTATVNVTVKCTGFAPLKFTWSPATADVEHVLVPLPK